MIWWKNATSLVISSTLFLASSMQAAADPSFSSTNYKVVESEVGSAGSLNGSSTNFQFDPSVSDGGSTLGESAGGKAASTNFQSNAGFNTSGQPGLTAIVSTSSVNFGVLTSGTSSTATASFSVINYTSYGYVVTISGTPPTYMSHPLTALVTDTAPNGSTEQFGINLRANTSPASFGTDPVQVPSGPPTFGYGVAGDGSLGGTTYGVDRPYTVPNNFRFGAGEVIASAPKSTGQTSYTISFQASISPTTPGGHYQSNLAIVVTGTY